MKRCERFTPSHGCRLDSRRAGSPFIGRVTPFEWEKVQAVVLAYQPRAEYPHARQRISECEYRCTNDNPVDGVDRRSRDIPTTKPESTGWGLPRRSIVALIEQNCLL
jgi:hypothetical protein